MNDISELEKIKLTEKHPIFMIDHETDIKTHTDNKPPTINSGVVLFENLSETKFSWEHLIEFGNKIGYIYRYKNSDKIIPGNDQALLQAYCENIRYDYHHSIFNIRYNTCSKKISYRYKDSKKRTKCRSIDDLTKDVVVNHYWGPFKPWNIDCPIFNK